MTSFAGIFDQVKDDIPIFTEEIYTFFTEGNSQEILKKYIEGLMDTYTKGTHLATDYTVINSIITHYKGTDKEDTIGIINSKISKNNTNKEIYHYMLFGLFISGVFLLIFTKHQIKIEYLIFTLYSILLLSLGIFLPMIAIDARIEELNFPFLGETIQFKNQILYF